MKPITEHKKKNMNIDLKYKKILFGNNVSHAHNKTRRKFKSNMQKKRIYLKDMNDFITVKCPVSSIRSLSKNKNLF